ncbi:DUF4012 domain-containing protein [Candidatus Roizmanbacteria bacterium]|nr:DUF4012 domain-containing protein [Candidatus Roizmanbacteria bacterium]
MRRKKRARSLVVMVIVALLGYFFLVRPIIEVRAKGIQVFAAARELKSAFSSNNIDLIKAKFQVFEKTYIKFHKEARMLYWTAIIPYGADFKNGVDAGDYLIKAGKESIDAMYPYADLIGFKKGEASFTEQSAENRLQTAVATLDKVLTKIDPISEDIHQAQQRIAKIDPNRYPEKLGKTIVRNKIENIKEQFIGLSSLFVDAKPLLKKIPEIMGEDTEKTYLLLFQNESEQRATGGFLTAYGVFKVKNGKITIERSEDIYSLDASIPTHPNAPDKIQIYHKDVSQFYIRDSNLSPDFGESIKLFESLYQNSKSKITYDGIIALDSKVLVDMLSIFGDTEVNGVMFSANKDEKCDCPQVLYKLFDMVDRPVAYVRENRKGILGDLMYALFYKAIGFSPSKYWGTLAQTMFQNLDEKHILLNFKDRDIQSSIEKLNYAGRINDYNGDYLHVNNVNFAGAKANLFVTQNIESVTKIKNGDQIERRVTITFTNPYPHSDCNLERGGLCLNATLRNWIRVYVPKGSKLIDFRGSIKKVLTYEDLGKTVYEGFMQVSPQGRALVVVTYSLPTNVDAKSYRLLIQKQPGTQKDTVKVEIDGSKVYDGLFVRDRELKRK